MDIKVTQTEPCGRPGCRNIRGVSGVCDECVHAGAVEFWAMAGQPGVVMPVPVTPKRVPRDFNGREIVSR